MSILYKKNRTMGRILRNKFHAAPASQLQAKPETAPAAYSLSTDSLSTEIPKRYNDTYVRAIPQDPQNTFVYWEMPKKEAASNGMKANGKIHTGNGEAEEIQNKINGGNNKPQGGVNNNNHQENNYRHNDNNHGNNNQYYDYESNSWRSGNNPQEQQPYHDNNNSWEQHNRHDNNRHDEYQIHHCDNHDSNPDGQHHRGNDGYQADNQTYRHDDNCRGQQQHYYSRGGNDWRYCPPEYSHILTEFTPPDNVGRMYMETPGVIAGTAVLTAKYSILLDFCKSQVNPNVAILPYLSSGVLYKKAAVSPPPHLSSGLLYNNPVAAGPT